MLNSGYGNLLRMANVVIDSETYEAKVNYFKKNYYSTISNCKLAIDYSNKYRSSINTELYYMLGKSYLNTGKKRKGKRYIKKAKKYNMYSDAQLRD